MRFRQLLPLFGALFALYIIWGSTYFVIRIGVESWPPLMMAGVRFLSAGMLLMAFLLLRGEKLPPLRQTINAALIGLLLLAVGNGLVTVAEHQNVPSGIAAVVVATVPLFTLCFSYFFGIKTRKLEWVGIAIGLAGIILLNSGGNLSGNPWGAILILIGSMSWAFGSVYGSRIALPVGMMAGAIEMLAAGVVLLCAAFLSGEKLATLPGLSGFMADRRIAGRYRAHIFTARGFIVNVRHLPSLSDAASPPGEFWVPAALLPRQIPAPPRSCQTGDRPAYPRQVS